ncbi:hypothetical protein ACE1TH_09575 [Shouchella sp. JSM 1781072]|uniref:hypothetical protein n=1 Tax=Shouchella sp. JSM 1781072 TaxID=3344581 RepID=UPI0035C21C0A
MSYYGTGGYGHYKPSKGFSARICPGCRCKKRCNSCNERPKNRPEERPNCGDAGDATAGDATFGDATLGDATFGDAT